VRGTDKKIFSTRALANVSARGALT